VETRPCTHADEGFGGFDVRLRPSNRETWALDELPENTDPPPGDAPGYEWYCGYKGEEVAVIKLTRPPYAVDGGLRTQRTLDEERLMCNKQEPAFPATGTVKQHRLALQLPSHSKGRSTVARALGRWRTWANYGVPPSQEASGVSKEEIMHLLKWRMIRGVPHRLRQMLAKMLNWRLLFGNEDDHELGGVVCEFCPTRGWAPHRIFECPASTPVWEGVKNRLHNAGITLDTADKKVLLGINKPPSISWRPWRQVWAATVWACWKKWVQLREQPHQVRQENYADNQAHEVTAIMRGCGHACLWRLGRARNQGEKDNILHDIQVWKKLGIMRQVERNNIPVWEVVYPNSGAG
jgi:hypothetical protein